MTEELLGSSETARRLRLHEATVRRWAEEGKLPCVRDSAGRRIFFAKDIDKVARERAAAKQEAGHA